MTTFSRLCDTADRLDSNPGFLVSVGLISVLLQDLEKEEIYPAIRFLLNEPIPIWSQGYPPLNVKKLVDTVCDKSVLSKKSFLRFVDQTHDLAEVIAIALKNRRDKSPNVCPTKMTVVEAYTIIRRLLERSNYKVDQSTDQLEYLFDVLSPNEVKHFVRNLLLERRPQSYEEILEKSISQLSSIELSEISRKNALVNDVALVGQVALSGEREDFSRLSLEILRPIKPMTAITAQSIEETNKEYSGFVSYEFKPDGIRVQIHKLGNQVRFFDRKLHDISHLLPVLTRTIVENVKAKNAVLEGELVCRDDRGELRPYSVLIGELRSREIGGNSTLRTPIDLELFEVLHLDGQDMMDTVYTSRRKMLLEISGRIKIIQQIRTDDPAKAESFYNDAIKSGYEGLLAKHLFSIYLPGVRTKFWAKIKESLKNLDLVIMFVHPDPNDSDRSESYLLGSRDLRTNQLVPITKCGEGLSEDERKWLDRKLEKVTLDRTDKGWFVLPGVVLEVSFEDINKDTSFPGGYWLDAPRAIRVRVDKSLREIDSLQWIERLAEEKNDS
ncbi:MAG: hypothetical protein JSW01_01215 [Candidatus Bathyarchaeota archaeon]|nr:MAG: hypothetical protein JSW01_01215 [Candidatus Bathyarchaeota archaeon]